MSASVVRSPSAMRVGKLGGCFAFIDRTAEDGQERQEREGDDM